MRRGSDFVFESIELLDYKLHKIKLKRRRSYIKSPRWIRNKAATINTKNEDDSNYFQYAITIALNHQDIENHPERISNIKLFIDKYIWRGIDSPSGSEDWKRLEQNNKTTALNILYVPGNKKIGVACKSKYKRKPVNQVVLLMTANDEKQQYLALKSIPTDSGYNHPIRSLSILLWNNIKSYGRFLLFQLISLVLHR